MPTISRKYHICTLLLSAILLASCSSGEKRRADNAGQVNLDQVSLSQVWATGQNDFITPECVTYDPGTNRFYVSNLNRDNDTDNDGYMSVVNADGSIQKARLTEGLGSPLGNDFYNGFLYVNDNGQVVKIDLEDGSVQERISVDGASDLNGMDIDEEGNIYSADSDGNKIFRITPSGDSVVLYEGEELNTPNGVLIREGELIIASAGGHTLKSLNLDTMELTTLVEGIGRADGIILLDEGHYITSSWTGEVYFISNKMEKKKILDTSAEEINAADVGYIPDQNLLVVPTFFDNRLVAYRLSY